MLDELRHFLLVCTHGTFTEAARRAHLSQPALSASIKRLEHAMGGRLLERSRQGARPTDAGNALKPWAEAALGAVEQCKRAVAAIEGLEAGEVRIGAGSTACTYLLPPILTRFQQLHRGIDLQLRESTSAVVRRRVSAGEIDLGIISDPDGSTAPLSGSQDPWYDDTLLLVSAPGMNPETARHLTFPPGANHRELLERHFPGVPIAMELNSLVAVKAHVAAGMGVALLSAAAIQREVGSGQLVVVDHPATPIPRTLHLIHPGTDRLNPAPAALRRFLLQSQPISTSSIQ